jgi:RNA polymerase sigma-70 factor (ECF subfamily)
MSDSTTSELQQLIERMNAGDPTGRDALIGRARERLHRLTRVALRDFQKLRVFEESDDVVQAAAMRLQRALESVQIATVMDFFRLASRHVRFELLDLNRRYFGPEGGGAHLPLPGHDAEPATIVRSDGALAVKQNAPEASLFWSEFHERVEQMPDDERETFELVWYQGLTQAEAAQALKVSVPTIKRRWLRARLILKGFLQGEDSPWSILSDFAHARQNARPNLRTLGTMGRPARPGW